jgi:hypothetical protein
MMFKLLRCTCLHCFHLKLEHTLLARYRQRLALLLQVCVRGSRLCACRDCHAVGLQGLVLQIGNDHMIACADMQVD